MKDFYCFEGIRNGATLVVDNATYTAIKNDPTQIVNKVVTLTGNGEAGYGSSGANPLGFVETVEKEMTNSDRLVVAVVFNQARENITCASGATAGNFLACDGTGGLTKSTTPTSAKAYSVDEGFATVYIHG